jgi:hypothetical protein
MRTHFGEMMMGAIYYSNPVRTASMSVFTLAALQDSGWYKVNFTKAERLDYGYQAGCSFISDNSCEKWSYNTGPYTSGYFCSTPKQVDCTFNHIFKGYCNMVNYTSSLSGYYQHYTNPATGGVIGYLDFCPLVQGYSNGDCRESANMDTNYARYSGESYTSNSRCFVGNLLASNSGYNQKSLDLRCLQTFCVNDSLIVQVGSQNITCPNTGGKITGVTGYTGYLNCPDYRVICGSLDTISPLFDPSLLTYLVDVKTNDGQRVRSSFLLLIVLVILNFL